MASLIFSSGYRMTPFPVRVLAFLFNHSSSSAYCDGLLPTFFVTLGNLPLDLVLDGLDVDLVPFSPGTDQAKAKHSLVTYLAALPDKLCKHAYVPLLR
jgi:hypothetical protein